MTAIIHQIHVDARATFSNFKNPKKTRQITTGFFFLFIAGDPRDNTPNVLAGSSIKS